ncbi:MAG: MdtA/MuxA family multidrug efflux RND transporter periplasmic adaptor subunit [Alphaproteobacteria bacterium]
MNDLRTREDKEEPTLKLRDPVRLEAPVSRHRPAWRRALWIGVLVVVALGVAWWIHTRPGPAAPSGRFAATGTMPVVAAVAQKGDVNVILNQLGTVTPLATVTVKTQINGQLIRINFTEGQLVKQGDLLAEIDARPYQLALEQAQGQLAKDQATLKDAQLDLERYQVLVKQDSIAKQTLDTQVATVGQLIGTVKTDQAQIDAAKLNIAYCHIIAPTTGKVGLRQVDQGNYVQTSDANGLVVLTQMQPISVVFTVPEDNLPAILKQVHAGAVLQAEAYDRSGTVKLATGKLATIDNQIDTTTGTLKMRAEFANEDEVLYPNQFVNIRLLVNTLHDVIVIPTAAIQRGAPGTFVYLVNADSTVAVRAVKLGPSEGENVAVTSGLAPDDRVVVDGADKLREGSKISLREAAGTTSATTAPASAATTAPAASSQPAAAAPGQPAAAAGPPAAAPTGAGSANPKAAAPAGGDEQQKRARRHKTDQQ